jgi:hypothetical protein
MILSLTSWDEAKTGNWITGRVVTYFKLRPGADIANVTSRFDLIIEKNVSHELEQFDHITLCRIQITGK